MNEKDALLCLNHVKGLGPVKIRRLLQQHGSAIAALTPEMHNDSWMRDLELCDRLGITLISFQDKAYPKSLAEIPGAPLFLYVKGALQEENNIAIVGTRNASIYGTEMAEKVAKDLARQGCCVVSGLARGIDTKAHKGALVFGKTVAVLGGGLGHIYPTENQALAQQISENGALVSEYPVNCPPSKEYFPRRNRIISGLSFATLLIEAPIKSGAMITMDFAHQHKRKCYALPGRSDMDNFRGNHLLIKEGRAQLIEDANDIVEIKRADVVKSSDKFLEPEEENLLLKMSNIEISLEELMQRSGLPIAKLNFLLMSLMLKNRIKEFPGKVYKIREPSNG